MNIIFSREFNYCDNKEFKSFVEEVINSKEMEEYKNLELSTDIVDNEVVNEFCKKNIESMFTINNITSFSFEICNINLTDKEYEAMRSFKYSFYPFSEARIELRIGSIYNKIKDDIIKGEFDTAKYPKKEESETLKNVLKNKIRDLLINKLHKKGIIYSSEVAEKKLEPKEILETYKNELIYRYSEFLNPKNTINSKDKMYQMVTPYNHCDTLVTDDYGFFNATLFSSKNSVCLYINRFDDCYEDYNYGERSYVEVIMEDKLLLKLHTEKIKKSITDYIKVLNTEVEIENKIDN